MEVGLRDNGRSIRGSALILGAAALLIVRAAPLVLSYVEKLSALHSPRTLALAAAAAAASLLTLTLGIRLWPRRTAVALALVALVLVVRSHNLEAGLRAALILAATALLGDFVFRLLSGREAEWGDLTCAFAVGLVSAGLLVLTLGEAGWLGLGPLEIAAATLAVARGKRAWFLVRRILASARLPRGDSPPGLEAAWLAFAAMVCLAAWAAVQGPDVSWDALAYHLPESRDIAIRGHVAPLPDLVPQSLLWRNHDAYLALSFLAGGERVARFVVFGVGLAVFGSALALARRLEARGAGPLIVLSLAAFPTAMLQLHCAYVDWPAALLVTAAAAQIASPSADAGRARTAGFLLGGAVVTKVFALVSLPALALLAWRARTRGPWLLAACLCALIPLAPWIAWSERNAGSFLAPYADSPRQLAERIARGHFFTTSPASGAARPGRGVLESASTFARLPYDLVFHSSRFEGNGDGYNGILVLLLALGVVGWGGRGAGLFLLAVLPFLIPWSLLYLPSVRFLMPVYPLYAVFGAEGLTRWTRHFAGPTGRAAGAAVLFAAVLFPVQFSSSGDEWRLALGRMSREQFSSAHLASWPLWTRIGPADRLILLGEEDRFDCPARQAWRAEFQPVAGWGRDPGAWRRGLADLGITHVLWRADRSPAPSSLGLPMRRLLPLARNGPAVLYRLTPEP